MLKIFKKIKKIKYKNQKKGIALVIAITVMTLLLSISFSISNIVLRQIKITNINNQSKPAFFIADSAIDCAIYYDTLFIASSTDPLIDINKDFSTSVFGGMLDTEAEAKIKCGNGPDYGKVMNLTKTKVDEKYTTTFDVLYGDMCANVELVKTEVDTNIVARGYNTGANAAGTGCDLTDLDKRRIVERGLTVKY